MQRTRFFGFSVAELVITVVLGGLVLVACRGIGLDDSGAPQSLSASYMATPLSGPAPLSVQFTDTSTTIGQII